MNQEQELVFKKAAEEALNSVCFRDKHGNFYAAPRCGPRLSKKSTR